MPDYQNLLFDRSGPITTITLNRPHKHNALDRVLSGELNHAVRQVRDDRDCHILILRGAGDTFCAGDDITEFNTWGPEDPYWQVRLYQETVQIIEDLTAEVEALCQVMLKKHPLTLRRTKFIMNKGADLHISGALAFEVPITPFSGTAGIADFTDRDARARRRELSRDFWQDRGVTQSATAR